MNTKTGQCSPVEQAIATYPIVTKWLIEVGVATEVPEYNSEGPSKLLAGGLNVSLPRQADEKDPHAVIASGARDPLLWFGLKEEADSSVGMTGGKGGFSCPWVAEGSRKTQHDSYPFSSAC